MSLLTQLAATFFPPPARAGVRPGRPIEAVASADDSEARPPGCGWFDSSHDLQHGLLVTEFAQVEAVVNQVPLSWWLGWELDAALGSYRPGCN